MRLRTSFFFNLAIVGIAAALLTIPGAAKQPATGYQSAPQASFGFFPDPYAEPVLSIAFATGPRSF